MGRKPKRGRYTPKKERKSRPASPARAFAAMGLRTGRVGVEDAAARRVAEEEFFAGTIFPERLTLLRPSAGPRGAVGAADPDAAGIVVALVEPGDVDADLRRLLEARAAEVDAQRWTRSVQGTVGWTTLASISGVPVADAEASFAKLNLHLTAPIVYNASFVFQLGQSRLMVRALAGGDGLFAVGLPELVQQLGTLSVADAVASLPVLTVPAAPQLSELLDQLDPERIGQ